MIATYWLARATTESHLAAVISPPPLPHVCSHAYSTMSPPWSWDGNTDVCLVDNAQRRWGSRTHQKLGHLVALSQREHLLFSRPSLQHEWSQRSGETARRSSHHFPFVLVIGYVFVTHAGVAVGPWGGVSAVATTFRTAFFFRESQER